jgi:four helix bundle protein
MDFGEWEKKIPEKIRNDALWTLKSYKLALFLVDLAWLDCTKLMSDRRTIGISDQLFRSVGSISANIAEGYSRGSGKDRARFYEYALGSAREARDWYYKARHVLNDEVADHRIALTTEIIRLLLTTVPQQRGYSVRESGAEYEGSTLDY